MFCATESNFGGRVMDTLGNRHVRKFNHAGVVGGGLLVFLAGIVLSTPLSAQTFVSGSTGADGALNPAANITIPLPPSGILNFTTINIPSNVTVNFTPKIGRASCRDE